MPRDYPYVHPIAVRFSDTDTEGHVYSGSYFVYCDEALMGLLEDAGYSWQSLADREQAIYYVESCCSYLSPTRYGDRLRVGTELTKIGNSSLRAEMTIEREQGGEAVATGALVAVMVSKTKDSSTPIPDEMRAALQAYVSG